MPDEALKASLQGRPRQAPDFSPLALSHLHSSCLAVRQLIKQYLISPSRSQLESLNTAVKDIHHTLQLLDRQGALLVTSELSLLIKAMARGEIDDADACAHSLVFAGERLADYVAHLQRPGAVDSALPLLPVINNCRACRGEELLSEMLVVASGIDLPDASSLPLPTVADIKTFIDTINTSRQPLMSGLVGWFTDKSTLHDSLSDLGDVFAKLSHCCDAPTSLQPLVPLFDSAGFICYSVQRGGLDNNAALHKLFAQLERLLDGYSKLDSADRSAFAKPVPERLFLNMLYYVALSTETSSHAVALRRRFRLDRFISRGITTDRSQVVFDGVGDRLADSIRDAIELETEAARAWLGNPARPVADLDRVRHRLEQLEPAILLLGAPESLRHLKVVNDSLVTFASPVTANTESAGTHIDVSINQTAADRVADALVRLERSLDTELKAVRARSETAQHSDLESILAACLAEAQLRLLEIEEDLINLFGDRAALSEPIKFAEVNAKLSMINSALQVLPLPEVSPLISGVQAFIDRHENQSISRSSHRDLATVMVSLGYYLNSVLQPNGAAGQLLLEAEEALLKLDIDELELNDDTLADGTSDITRLIGLGKEAAGTSSANDYDATIVDYTLDTEAENFIDVSLSQMGIINNTLFDYEQASQESDAEMRQAQRHILVNAYEAIGKEASAFNSAELAELAQANIRLLESNNDSRNAQNLLEESAAVLPQLINQMHSSSDKVFGLRALLDQLNDAAVEDLTLAMDVQNILAQNSTDDTSALDPTLVVDSLSADSTLSIDGHSIDEPSIDEPSADVLSVDSSDLLPETIAFDDTRLVDDTTHLLSGDEYDQTLAHDSAISGDESGTGNSTASNLVGSAAAQPDGDIVFATDAIDLAASDQSLDELSLTRLDYDETGGSAPVMTLDNTLEQVFFRECDQHMLSLRQVVSDALSSSHWEKDSHKAMLDLSTQQAGVDRAEVASATALPNRTMLRALHTLTGSAQTVDAQGIIAIAQPLQKAALHKQRSGDQFDRSETEYIGELLDVLQARLDAMEANEPFNDDNTALVARLKDFVARSEPWVPERKPGLQFNDEVNTDVRVGDGTIESVFEQEARELLEGMREESHRLSDDELRPRAIDNILSRLHTIKGSARMAGQTALADRAHELEDEIRLAEGVALDEAVSIGLGELQTRMLLDAPVAESDRLESPQRSEPMGLTEATFENMLSLATRATMSQAKLGESILRLRDACRDIESSSARLQRLPHQNAELQSAAVVEMLSDLDNAQRMLADALLDAEAEHTQGSRADAALHQTLIRAQLVSFAECHTRLQHAVNDAAKETDKQVEFQLLGGELNIDKATYRKLTTPLEHLIRNAVVHGVEAPAERSAAGKSTAGMVTVDAKIDGTDLVISVTDDGAGIDLQAIAVKAAKGEKLDQLAPAKLLDILSESGFSTHENADQLGGRGIGLTTVKQLVKEMQGDLQLVLPASGGSVFSLRVPQKIRINQVVLVEHHSALYAIPVNFIHTVSDEPYDMSGADIQFNGNDYTSCSLDAVLNDHMSSDLTTDTVSTGTRVILIGVHDKHVALLVDNVIGYREVIAQPLGAQFSNLKRYLGGAMLADGRPVLIPDFNRLLDAQKTLPVANWSAANASVVSRTALIVDDSITMRIAAEQMLQNLGFEPSMARDGAEALELVGEALPDVLLVDIDMPRMNGFDFLQHLRVLRPDHSVPVIMISTRDTDEDRRKARELGATQYLVKPYTEQQMLEAMTTAALI